MQIPVLLFLKFTKTLPYTLLCRINLKPLTEPHQNLLLGKHEVQHVDSLVNQNAPPESFGFARNPLEIVVDSFPYLPLIRRILPGVGINNFFNPFYTFMMPMVKSI